MLLKIPNQPIGNALPKYCNFQIGKKTKEDTFLGTTFDHI